MDKWRTEKNQCCQDNQDGQRFTEYPFQCTDHTPFNIVDVVTHSADQVPFALFSKKTQRQFQNF